MSEPREDLREVELLEWLERDIMKMRIKILERLAALRAAGGE